MLCVAHINLTCHMWSNSNFICYSLLTTHCNCLVRMNRDIEAIASYIYTHTNTSILTHTVHIQYEVHNAIMLSSYQNTCTKSLKENT